METQKRKIALVTGGSSGIGLALARQLVRQGAHVWLLARNSERLSAALESIVTSGVNAEQCMGMVAADVSDVRQVNAAVDQVISKIGLPDLVFNCAGVTQPGYFQDQSLDIFRWVMEVNYFGTVHVCKAIVPDMIARGSGHIINISSVTGFLGFFGYTAYGASKFAVAGFSEILRAEMNPKGIRVSVVFPPDVDTPQLAYENPYKPIETRRLTSFGKVMTPEAVASAVMSGVARGQYLILPGGDAKLAYALRRLLGSAVYPVLDLALRVSEYVWRRREKRSGEKA